MARHVVPLLSVVITGVPSWLYMVGVQAGGWQTPPAPWIGPATAALQGCGPGVALNRSIEDVVGEDTVAFVVTENLHHSCAGARYLPRLLKVGEGEQPVLPDRTAQHAAVLMALQLRFGAVEVVNRIQLLVAVELEESAVEAVGSGLSHCVHDGAGKLAVLGGEAVGDQAKLRDRVGVWNQTGAHILGFIYLRTVHQEGVGTLRHTVGGDIARRVVKTGSGRAIVVAAVRIRRRDPWLKGEQIEVRTAVERHGQNLSRGDRRALDVLAVSTCTAARIDGNGLVHVADLKREIEVQRVVDVEDDVINDSLLEPGIRRSHFVSSGRQSEQGCTGPTHQLVAVRV